jgi:hypothetical protein
MSPVKIRAISSAVRFRSVTPSTLWATAMGPRTIGRFRAVFPRQRFSALSVSITPSRSLRLSGESEPARSTAPPKNAFTPAPEPDVV